MIDFQQMENNANKKIHPQDLSEALKALGKRCTRKEIEYMIWEVNDTPNTHMYTMVTLHNDCILGGRKPGRLRELGRIPPHVSTECD